MNTSDITLRFLIDDGQTPLQAPSPQSNLTPMNTQVQQSSIKGVAIVGLGYQLGKQAVSGTINTIGDRTGNYYLQDQINVGMKLGGIGLAYKIGGPIVGTLALGNLALSEAFKLDNAQRSNRRADRVSEINQQRLGGFATNYGRESGRSLWK